MGLKIIFAKVRHAGYMYHTVVWWAYENMSIDVYAHDAAAETGDILSPSRPLWLRTAR